MLFIQCMCMFQCPLLCVFTFSLRSVSEGRGLISISTPTLFRVWGWRRRRVYIKMIVTSSYTHLLYRYRFINKIPDLQEHWVILQEEYSPCRGLAKFHQGQRPVSVCHHHYCTIGVLTDFWCLDEGRIFALHPKEVISSAPPTQRLFTPDRLLHSFWDDSADREGTWRKNVMQGG